MVVSRFREELLSGVVGEIRDSGWTAALDNLQEIAGLNIFERGFGSYQLYCTLVIGIVREYRVFIISHYSNSDILRDS